MTDAKLQTSQELADNPFLGFADIAFESVQLEWGWALLVVGSLLLISAAVVRPSKDNKRSLSPFLLGIGLLALAFPIILGGYTAIRRLEENQPSNTESIAFLSNFENLCFSNQTKTLDNIVLSNMQVRELCACMNSHLSKEVTEDEAKYFNKFSRLSDTLDSKIFNADVTCRREIHD